MEPPEGGPSGESLPEEVSSEGAPAAGGVHGGGPLVSPEILEILVPHFTQNSQATARSAPHFGQFIKPSPHFSRRRTRDL